MLIHIRERKKKRWKRKDVAVTSYTFNFSGTTSFQTKKKYKYQKSIVFDSLSIAKNVIIN